jgi:peroxiredoxin Q/BCP
MRTLFTVSVLILMFLSKAHAANAPAAGQMAPEFRLQDAAGQWHALSEYRGKWVALYFYPKDGTPGCTTEACEFRDNVFAFRDANAVIIGISVDDVEDHKKFAEKHSLPFTILADSDKKVSEAYGVLTSFLGWKFSRRETFLIDPNGRVAKHYADVSPKGHSQELLADIKAMQGKK